MRYKQTNSSWMANPEKSATLGYIFQVARSIFFVDTQKVFTAIFKCLAKVWQYFYQRTIAFYVLNRGSGAAFSAGISYDFSRQVGKMKISVYIERNAAFLFFIDCNLTKLKVITIWMFYQYLLIYMYIYCRNHRNNNVEGW